jgi:hypothetical protein
MSKLEEVYASQVRNQEHRFVRYDLGTVLVPFEHLRMLSRTFHQQRTQIAQDRLLTNEGKTAALEQARASTRKAIEDWHAERLRNIDADLLEQRAAFIKTTKTPSATRVSLMAVELAKFTPQERAVFYNAATEDERREMEAASAATGRLPIKTGQGLELKPLLDPEMVNVAIVTRAEMTNPAAAQKLHELEEVRRMQVTMTGVALSEI